MKKERKKTTFWRSDPVPEKSWRLSPNDYHPFPVLKQNLGDRRFTDDCEVETAVTLWLITQDTVKV